MDYVLELIKSNMDSGQVDGSMKNFDWLLGKWERLGEEEGKATFENWEKQTSDKYLGHGFVMQDTDTVW